MRNSFRKIVEKNVSKEEKTRNDRLSKKKRKVNGGRGRKSIPLRYASWSR